MDWHQKELKAVLAELDVPIDGLRSEEAGKRLAKYGRNELVEKGKRSLLAMFLDQFRDFMILILIAAAVVSGFVGELADTIAILVIVILNAVIGFVQEYRAEKAMEALKQMAAPAARVLRDGSVSSVPGSEIVPGDLVLLEAGGIVPADMRLTEAARLKIEEAALTGESVPVEKHTRALHEEMLSLGDRSNMVFKGTVVTYGRGTGVVVGTGMGTELGKIASMLQEEEEVKTPLQKRLTVFGKKIAVAILFICAFIFGVGLLRGEAPVLMFLTAVSLAVAAIPEALPAVITISLALGARKMVEHNALIRKLPAVETLGSVTTICSDKTGTLTLNRMTVEEVFANGTLFKSDDPEIGRFDHLLKALALSNDALPYTHEDIIGVSGDPTEIALYRVAKEHGFLKADLEKEHPRVAEIPFDSERKCMTTFHRWPGGYMALTKGGVDVMLEKAVNVLTERKLAPLDADEISRVNDRMADDGLRVLAVAARLWNEVPDDLSPEHVETGAHAARSCGHAGPAPGGGPPGRGSLQVRRHPARHDHGRPPADGALHRPAHRDRRGRGHGDDLPGPGQALPRGLREPGGGHPGLRPDDPRAEAQDREGPSGQGADRGHDGRRRERCPGAQAGRHRDRHGDHGDGRLQGGLPHDPAGRQLRHHRERHQGRPDDLRQHPEVHQVPPGLQFRRGLDALPGPHPGAAASPAADPDPLDEPRHGQPPGARPGRGARRGGGDEAPAAGPAGGHLRPRTGRFLHLGGPADGGPLHRGSVPGDRNRQ